MDFLVFWTEKAEEDRERIFEFWNKRNASNIYSRRINELVEKYLKLTKLYPGVGLATNRLNVRYHLMGRNFKLFYKISGKKIIILRFWDVRQNPKKLTGL
ncbi:MAG TPA: type II toxin-antitoxin system RelE/ParE family toxin [Saprospiraceae bacterium]|nr:type II toxin-antitoxin system RelE/ParE family toxin [Saprospiraceae bacterium]